MSGRDRWKWRDVEAILTSMHRKERVIAPALREGTGLLVGLAKGVNTDLFGTFSSEIERSGSQLDAARAKVEAGFDRAPSARVGLASEGSFGPHPHVPFLAVGRELVLLVDRETGLELSGHDESPQTNFAHRIVHDREEAIAFAKGAGFPAHGLIVMGCRDARPAPEIMLRKDITDANALEAAAGEAVKLSGAAFVETDMRAHRNPTRMAAIERAARDLVRRFHSRCPECDHSGFDVTERLPGLPCAWCGVPTRVVLAEILTCQSCGHRREHPAGETTTADPGQCDGCNP